MLAGENQLPRFRGPNAARVEPDHPGPQIAQSIIESVKGTKLEYERPLAQKLATGFHTCIEPCQLYIVEHQVSRVSRGDVDCGVPADVAASEGGEAGFAVAGEDPLLAVFVFEVANVEMRFLAVDDRWIAASRCVMVWDL
jgi:hypothetical protein